MWGFTWFVGVFFALEVGGFLFVWLGFFLNLLLIQRDPNCSEKLGEKIVD